MSTVFNDQDIEFDNIKLTILDSIKIKKDPVQLTNSQKNYNDDSIGEGTKHRYN